MIQESTSKRKIDHLKIKSYFSLIPHSLNQVELRKGVWDSVSYMLNDDTEKGVLFYVLSDLNGENSVSDIAKKYNLSRSDIEGVVDQLHQLNVIDFYATSILDHYVDQACPSVMQRHYATDGVSAKELIVFTDNECFAVILDNLASYVDKSKIALYSNESDLYASILNSTDDWLYDELKLERMLAAFSRLKNKFIIILQKNMNPVFCSRFNVIANYLKISWIQAAIDGPFLFIGPLITTQRGACYECFETRVSINLRQHDSYVRYKQAIVDQNIYHRAYDVLHKPLINLLVSHLSLEVINYIAFGTSFLRSKVLSIYLPTMEIVFNDVLRLSTCSVCGVVEHKDNSQLYFDYQSIFLEE